MPFGSISDFSLTFGNGLYRLNHSYVQRLADRNVYRFLKGIRKVLRVFFVYLVSRAISKINFWTVNKNLGMDELPTDQKYPWIFITFTLGKRFSAPQATRSPKYSTIRQKYTGTLLKMTIRFGDQFILKLASIFWQPGLYLILSCYLGYMAMNIPSLMCAFTRNTFWRVVTPNFISQVSLCQTVQTRSGSSYLSCSIKLKIQIRCHFYWFISSFF